MSEPSNFGESTRRQEYAFNRQPSLLSLLMVAAAAITLAVWRPGWGAPDTDDSQSPESRTLTPTQVHPIHDVASLEGKPRGTAGFYIAIAQVFASIVGLAGGVATAYYIFAAEKQYNADAAVLQHKIEIREILKQMSGGTPYTANSQAVYFPTLPEAGRAFARAYPTLDSAARLQSLATSLYLDTTRPELRLALEGLLSNDLYAGVSFNGRLYLWMTAEMVRSLTRPLGRAGSSEDVHAGVFPYTASGVGFEEWRNNFEYLYQRLIGQRERPPLDRAELHPYVRMRRERTAAASLMPSLYYSDALIAADIDYIQRTDVSLRNALSTVGPHLLEIDKLAVVRQQAPFGRLSVYDLRWLVALGALTLLATIILPLILALPRFWLAPAVVLLVATSVFGVTMWYALSMAMQSQSETHYECARWVLPLRSALSNAQQGLRNGEMPEMELIDDAAKQRGLRLVSTEVEALKRLVGAVDVVYERLPGIAAAFEQMASGNADLLSFKDQVVAGGRTVHVTQVIDLLEEGPVDLNAPPDIYERPRSFAVEMSVPEYSRRMYSTKAPLTKNELAAYANALDAIGERLRRMPGSVAVRQARNEAASHVGGLVAAFDELGQGCQANALTS